jgi:hypothetical protein
MCSVKNSETFRKFQTQFSTLQKLFSTFQQPFQYNIFRLGVAYTIFLTPFVPPPDSTKESILQTRYVPVLPVVIPVKTKVDVLTSMHVVLFTYMNIQG